MGAGRDSAFSIAVGIGLARVVPLLDSGAIAWPYEALCVAYCSLRPGPDLLRRPARQALGRTPCREADRAGWRNVPRRGGLILGIATILVVALAR